MPDPIRTQSAMVSALVALSQWTPDCETCKGRGQQDGAAPGMEDCAPDCPSCNATGEKRCEWCSDGQYERMDGSAAPCDRCLDGSALPPWAEKCPDAWHGLTGDLCSHCDGRGHRVILPLAPTEAMSLKEVAYQLNEAMGIPRDGIATDPREAIVALLDGVRVVGGSGTEVQCWVTQERAEKEKDGWLSALRSECEALGLSFEDAR